MYTYFYITIQQIITSRSTQLFTVPTPIARGLTGPWRIPYSNHVGSRSIEHVAKKLRVFQAHHAVWTGGHSFWIGALGGGDK